MDGNSAIRIRETAHDLIAERGYFGFSYADIAETVGIRKASIHHHFPSKVDLVVATLKEYEQNSSRLPVVWTTTSPIRCSA